MENIADIVPLAGVLGLEVFKADAEEVRGRMDWAPERCTAAGSSTGAR